MFYTVHRRLCEQSASADVKKECRCSRTTRTTETEERILKELERNHTTSIQMVSRKKSIRKFMMRRILHDE